MLEYGSFLYIENSPLFELLEEKMTTAANKRSVMTLFSNHDDIYCHQVRFVLAEKGASYEIEIIEPNTINEQLMELNPTGSVPTLTDRTLAIHTPYIILEYLDERFPHPPLMPVFPVERAEKRQLMKDILDSWYAAIREAEHNKSEEKRAASLNHLKEQLLASAAAFQPYFMGNEFSLVDCYIAPLLWKMHTLGVKFTGTGSKNVRNYMELVFNRESFRDSVRREGGNTFTEDK